MKLPQDVTIVEHIIWQPRYRDKTVLIAKRVVAGHNVIWFTDAPSMGKTQYYASGKTIQLYKPESMKTKRGSGILVHPVPLDELVIYEGRE